MPSISLSAKNVVQACTKGNQNNVCGVHIMHGSAMAANCKGRIKLALLSKN